MAAFINLQYCLQELFFNISLSHNGLGLSNYDVLVQKAYEYAIAKKEDVLFVTFNYDLLLEFAFAKVYSELKSEFTVDDYINKQLKLIKPHGSCNWFRHFKATITIPNNTYFPDFLFKKKTTIKEINDWLENEELFTLNNKIIEGLHENSYTNYLIGQFPQILIPLKNKDEFILPKSHLNYLGNHLRDVDEILIIGWKGTEEKFQELLKNNIRDKKIKITSVNACSTNIEVVLKPFLPNAEFFHFKDYAIFKKSNNTVFSSSYDSAHEPLGIGNDPVGSRISYSGSASAIEHPEGSFSAYILKLLNSQVENFFTY